MITVGAPADCELVAASGKTSDPMRLDSEAGQARMIIVQLRSAFAPDHREPRVWNRYLIDPMVAHVPTIGLFVKQFRAPEGSVPTQELIEFLRAQLLLQLAKLDICAFRIPMVNASEEEADRELDALESRVKLLESWRWRK